MSTAMQFGPEWMRPKTQTSRSSTRESSPPPMGSPAPPGGSTYSALLTPSVPAPTERLDGANPFKYSRDELLRIYQEGGGKGSLGLEVERWEGVVREVSNDPVALKEISEADKKLFAGSLNSELRRRQSTDYLSIASPSGDRPKLYHSNSGAVSPMRDRFGSLLGRRKDSTDQPTLSIPRKLSVSNINGPLHSPREAALPSPRLRGGVSPGFDGILSSGDSWMARRRTSDATRPGGLSTNRGGDNPGGDGRKSDIKEEEEEEGKGQSERDRNPSTNDSGALANTLEGANHSGPSVAESHQGLAGNFEAQGLSQGLGNLSIGAGLASTTNPVLNGQSGQGVGARSAPAPSAADLANVEWSYIDPQGSIQGPFRADVMQNWHDAGFFTPDLRMKRTHLDTEWISVGEMLARTDTNQIFLVPALPPAVPPGLGRRHDGVLESPAQAPFTSPFQPVPSRNLRSATLDTYLSGPSTASNSPASSFSAGRFGNSSPDPHAFGGQAGLYSTNDPIVGSRLQTSFSVAPEPARRATFGDPMLNPYGGIPSPYGGNMGPIHSPVGGFGYGGGVDPIHRGPLEVNSNFASGFGSPAFSSPVTNPMYASSIPHSVNHNPVAGRQRSGSIGLGGAEYRQAEDHHNHFAMNRPTFGTTAIGADFDANGIHGLEASHAENQSPVIRNAGPAQAPNQPAAVPESTNETQAAPSVSPVPSQREPVSAVSLSIPAQVTPPPASSTQSPWGTTDIPSATRPTPFGAPHPKISNTVPANTMLQAGVQFASRAQDISIPKSTISTTQTAWGTSRQNSQAPSAISQRETSPWVAASQGIVQEGWGESHGGASSLTFSNLVQHNQQQEVTTSPAVHDSPARLENMPLPTQPETATPPKDTAAVPVAEVSAGTAPKSQARRKSSNKAANPDISAAVPAPPTPEISASSAKPAWVVEDDKKSKASGVSLGFREIQEAEAKQAESRKVAEKERAARAVAQSSPADEPSAFVASWGLPTSKTGARGGTTPAAKETAAPGAATGTPATPPVWTGVAKAPPAKKGMKEIQEEEEKRKKLAIKEKESVAAATRRGYADTTTKVAPVLAPLVTGGAWTTVGSTTTKATTPVATPTRPPMASVLSSSVTTSTSARANGSVIAARTPATVVPKPIAATTSREDFPLPPSQEFLKWLAESLKGLNSSVNYEDITSMLLTFPLDPDPSTTELIAEMIYASSQTLDGRRFAAEFVSKRKMDAATRVKVGASGSVAKPSTPSSIADIVKAQPKPAQNEWGGFKVVNKKKKSGKA